MSMQPPIGRADPQQTPCVVIVDDDAALLEALTFALEAEGLSVAAYADAPSALAAPLAKHGCLVLDQKLPGITGLELLERFRARGETAPALLITTHPSADTRARAHAAGVEIMEKPLLGDALARKVLELTGAPVSRH